MSPSLTRRALLRGLGGAGLALPMGLGRPARASTAGGPTRFVVLYLPNGMRMDAWSASLPGQPWTPGRVFDPLQPLMDDILPITGLDNIPYDPWASGHNGPCGAALTGDRNGGAPAQSRTRGLSVDQLLAQSLGASTPIPSLVLSAEGSQLCQGNLDGCAGLEHVSYLSGARPVPRTFDPRSLFDRLFGAAETPEARAQRRARDRTVVDAVLEASARLTPALPARDRTVLDEYLESVHALEQELFAEVDPRCADALDPALPPLAPSMSVDDQTAWMLELLALALHCDQTRIATFMFATEASRRVYGFLGQGTDHHLVSHHRGRHDRLAALEAICRWEMTHVARFLTRLRTLSDPDGTPVLDRTVVLVLGGISDPDAHSIHDLPVVLAGRGDGTVTPGRTLAFDGRPLADLHLGILDAFGVSVPDFGLEGTRTIALG